MNNDEEKGNTHSQPELAVIALKTTNTLRQVKAKIIIALAESPFRFRNMIFKLMIKKMLVVSPSLETNRYEAGVRVLKALKAEKK